MKTPPAQRDDATDVDLAEVVLDRLADGASVSCTLVPLLDALAQSGQSFSSAFLVRPMRDAEPLCIPHSSLRSPPFEGAQCKTGPLERAQRKAPLLNNASLGVQGNKQESDPVPDDPDSTARRARFDAVLDAEGYQIETVLRRLNRDWDGETLSREEIGQLQGGKSLQGYMAACGWDYGRFEPITGRNETALGTLVCLWRGEPSLAPEDASLVEKAARLAARVLDRMRHDEQLEQHPGLFEAIGHCMPGIVFQFLRCADGSIRVPYASRSAETLYGVDPRDFARDASQLQDIIHPADWASFVASMERSAESLTQWDWEGRVIPPSGQLGGRGPRWVRLAARPTKQPGGHVLWNGLLMDSTKERGALRHLKRSEKRYYTLFESAGDAIFIMDDQTFVDCNAQALDLYGCRHREQLIGHTPLEFSPPVQPDGQASEEKAASIIDEVLGGEAMQFEWQHTRLDGSPFDAEVTLNRLQLEDTVLVQAIVRDVTERRAAQRALRASEERWQRLAERHPDGLVITVGDEIRYINPSGAAIYGLDSPEELIGRSVHDLFQENLQEIIAARQARLDRGQPTPPVEVTVTCLDGTEKVIDSRAVPIEHEGERAALSVMRDITSRRAAEEELEQSERKYRRLVEQTADWIWETDARGRLTYVSPQIQTITGYDPDDMLGRSVFNVLKDTGSSPSLSDLARQGDDPKPFARFQSALVGKDGIPVHLETSRAPIFDDGRLQGYHGVSRDITGRVAHQERLERQAIRLGIVNEISSSILEVTTPKAIVEAALSRLETLVPFFSASYTEYIAEELTAVFLARRPTNGVPASIREHAEVRDSPGMDHILNGNRYYVRDLQAVESRTPAQQDLLAWGARSYVVVPSMAEGDIIASLNVTRAEADAFSNEDLLVLDEVANLLALALHQARSRERLAEAKADAEAAREEAEEMNRLKSAFLANMSHEIRTPLTSVIGFSEVLQGMELPDTAAEFANLIDKGGQRLLQTLESVLDLSQLEAGTMDLQLDVVEITGFVRELEKSFMPQAREAEVQVTTDLPNHAVHAAVDKPALDRIVSNLLSNALKFTPSGGHVTIRVRSNADKFRLEVEDTGVGIAPDFQPHLFDAFKQESTGAMRAFEGSGLGLTIVKKLTDLMEGRIEVDSKKGKGTTMRVILPKGTDA